MLLLLVAWDLSSNYLSANRLTWEPSLRKNIVRSPITIFSSFQAGRTRCRDTRDPFLQKSKLLSNNTRVFHIVWGRVKSYLSPRQKVRRTTVLWVKNFITETSVKHSGQLRGTKQFSDKREHTYFGNAVSEVAVQTNGDTSVKKKKRRKKKKQYSDTPEVILEDASETARHGISIGISKYCSMVTMFTWNTVGFDLRSRSATLQSILKDPSTKSDK